MPTWLIVVIPWSIVEKDSEAAAECKVSWLIIDVCHECGREHMCSILCIFSLSLLSLIQNLNLDLPPFKCSLLNYNCVFSTKEMIFLHCFVNIRILWTCEQECRLIHSTSVICVLTLAQGIFTYHKLPVRMLFSKHRLSCTCVCTCPWR